MKTNPSAPSCATFSRKKTDMSMKLITIAKIQTALEAHGLTFPTAALESPALPTFTTPTREELTSAILAAKGNPETDKTVQALVTRSWLADKRVMDDMHNLAEEQRISTAVDAVADLSDTIRELHAEQVEVLTDAAPHLTMFPSLDDIQLATVPASLLPHATAAIQAYRTARSLYGVWADLHYLRTGQGFPKTDKTGRETLAAPDQQQLDEALSATPQTLPAGDEWSIIRHGWNVDLASSPTAGRERYMALIDAINAADRGREPAAKKVNILATANKIWG